MATISIVSADTPWPDGPPLSLTKCGMHGGEVVTRPSCRRPPGAHRDLSPANGRPSSSTDCPAAALPATALFAPSAAAGVDLGCTEAFCCGEAVPPTATLEPPVTGPVWAAT